MNRRLKLTRSFFLGSILCLFVCGASPTLRAQNSGFVYVGNSAPFGQTPTILGFSIADNNGALTPVPGSPFQIASPGTVLAVTPSGRFLYSPTVIPGAQYSWGVAGYAIDANSGSLTPLTGSPFFASFDYSFPANTLVMDPLGRFLYALNFVEGVVFVYSIDQNSGALTLQTNSQSNAQYAYPNYFGLDATGQFAYITSYQPFRSPAPGGAISVYKIDQATGALTLVPGSPFIVPRDPSSANKFWPPEPSWAVTDPSSSFLYVPDISQKDLWTFSIDPASGALTLLPSSPLHIPYVANQITIDPAGDFAYFTTDYPAPGDCGNYYPFTNVQAPNAVYVYSIDRTSGALSPAKTPVLTAGYRTFPVATDASGTYVYALNLLGYNNDSNSSTISAYRSRGIGGPLTEVLGSPFAAGAKANLFSLVVAAPQKKN